MFPKLERRQASRWITCTLLAYSATSSRALSTLVVPKYTSCASPKFDQFSGKIIGEWQWKENESTVVESVEEVMRSCGGAVQGFRELPSLSLTTNQEEGGYYLNRANDGFIYFDEDGSYSCGPVREDDEAGGPWISSISLGLTRLLLRKDDVSQDAIKKLQVCRKSFGEPKEIPKDSMLEKLPDNIDWQKFVRCRMPSPTMPWMANRLKWEKCTFKNGNDVDENKIGEIGDIQTWAFKADAAEDPIYKAVLEDDGNSIVWSAGAMCRSTGTVKSILRQYKLANGSLQIVAWLEGRVRPQVESE